MIARRTHWLLGVLVAASACDSKTLMNRPDGGRKAGDALSGADVAPVSQPPTAGQCPDGYAPCGDGEALRCYDLGRSPDHCGACGNGCATGIDCQAGVCGQHGCKGALSFKTLVFASSSTASALGDFDGDGILDLIGSSESAPLSLSYGRGDGTFGLAQAIASDEVTIWPDSGAPLFMMGLQALTADLDGDGLSDLVTLMGGESAFKVRRGSGNREAPFDAPARYPTTKPASTALLADFDADGRLDLVASMSGGLEYWQGRAGGRFERRTMLSLGNSATAVAPYAGLVQAIDWNSDGFLDLVYTEGGIAAPSTGVFLGGAGRLHHRLGHGDGTFDPEVTCALSIGIVGDLDHDRRPDVISALSTMGATLSLGVNGCTASRIVPITDWTKQGGVALADFNGDGNLDVVVDDNLAIMVHVGDGRGGFPHELTFPAPSQGVWPLGQFLVGDLNADGKLDIVFSRDARWGVLLNTCQ